MPASSDMSNRKTLAMVRIKTAADARRAGCERR
jgi:hypothetical protein